MTHATLNASRRHWLLAGAAASLSLMPAAGWAQRSAQAAQRVLILVELKGGNDGLNTIIPYQDAQYYALRPQLAIAATEVLRVDPAAASGWHPALKPLLPVWERGELAIVQGVGYPQPNLSHFRSIEIWDTASAANEYLEEGWVARGMKAGLAAQRRWTTQGIIVGAGDYGPLSGAEAVTLSNTENFVQQARMASRHDSTGNAALQHLLRVENAVTHAAQGLQGSRQEFRVSFPNHAFGHAARTAAQIVADQRDKGGVPVMRLSLGSFDTHQNQAGPHANLLKVLAEGLEALRAALVEIGAWDRSLIMTYSEFGRRPRQNQSNGTDHGTSAPQLLLGGAVRGGWHGQAPDLQRLDAGQNLLHSVDFRQIFATVSRDWWGVDPAAVVRGSFGALPLLKT
jgi:uncharacterized protein (DUF1501 family)